MVIANTGDGKTHTFDLTVASDRRELSAIIRDNQVTGLSLHFGGCHTSLVTPRKFKRPFFGFELITGCRPAERVFAQADGVRVTLTRSLTSKHVRCDLVHTGALRYNPVNRGVI